MRPALPIQRRGTSGTNTDGQERGSVEEHHPVENFCLLGTLEVLKTHSTEEAVCKSLMSHFCFGISPNYSFYQYGVPNHSRGPVA